MRSSASDKTEATLEKLRGESARQRKALEAKGAVAVLIGSLLIVALFLGFYLLGPKGRSETTITIVGLLMGLGLFAFGLNKLLS